MRLKNILSPGGPLLAASCFLFIISGCIKDNVKKTETYRYTIITPVYKTKAEMSTFINGNSSEPVNAAGKLYIKDQFIYLNEKEKGIHIIDNSDPSHPEQVAFLNIPGNLDIAVKGNTLYADTYSDLLAIDISNPKKVAVTKSIPNFFLDRVNFSTYNNDSNLIVAGIIKKDTIVTMGIGYPTCLNCVFFAGGTAPLANSSTTSVGTAGSMASMVLMNDYLYALREPHSMAIVDVHTSAAPHFDTTFSAGYDLQTIFPFEDKLLLGSLSGMYMYDVSNPVNPVKLGEFAHGRACDPVVTDGAFAYVTLHAGTSCGGAANELDVINIKDPTNATLLNTYNLTKPTGLCKDGNLLFVCDDDSGVRVYDATDASNLKQLDTINIKGSYDIIAGNQHAMVVTDAGLYQYDYSNLNNIRALSFYPLKN